ncbi:MAG: hypothetical protein U0U67_03840 [Chitinophagales bacterium]
MNIAMQKQEIHALIEEADGKVVQAVHSLLSKIKTNQPFALTDEEIKQLDKEFDDYKKGKTKGYTLEEAKKIISSKR